MIIQNKFYIFYFTSTFSIFFIVKYAIKIPNDPIANATGNIVISDSLPPLFEHTTETNITAEIIVVGVDFFLIPKNNGINAIPAATTAFIIIRPPLLIITDKSKPVGRAACTYLYKLKSMR